MQFEEILSNLTRYLCPAECFNEVTIAFGFNVPPMSFPYGFAVSRIEPIYRHYSKTFTIHGMKIPNTNELRRKYMCE